MPSSSTGTVRNLAWKKRKAWSAVRNVGSPTTTASPLSRKSFARRSIPCMEPVSIKTGAAGCPVVIVLDTDHVNALQSGESAASTLVANMGRSVDEDFATTAITIEEQMRAG